jgi:hypothetical protein
MSMVAIIPAVLLDAANKKLEAAGFGPSNFSVAAYTGPGISHAAFHSWNDPAFEADVQAIAGVVWEISEGNHEARVTAMIKAQGAKWGDRAAALPDKGTVKAGDLLRDTDGNLWSVIQPFSRTTYGAAPETYPALIRRVRDPKATEEYKQPIDQYDSYSLKNPFTGAADRVTVEGKTYASLVNANVWKPPSAQWQEIDPKTGEPIVPVKTVAAWKQPAGAHDAYKAGDQVTFGGKTYASAIDANVWSPTAYPAGWKAI